ncbi:MAG: endonuclease domain-containing protein [Chitinophagales bacterium]
MRKYDGKHRNSSTKAEIKIWKTLLRNRMMLGYSFKRQRPIGNYIADFFSPDLKLIIETDGISHWMDGSLEKDVRRENQLQEKGFTVLRFEDSEVMQAIVNVSRAIENWILQEEEKNPDLKKHAL